MEGGLGSMGASRGGKGEREGGRGGRERREGGRGGKELLIGISRLEDVAATSHILMRQI